MAFWSNFSNLLSLNLLLDKDTFNLFLVKAEVITDSTLIVNSVRVLIITTALLLAFIHTSEEENQNTGTIKKELHDNSLKPIIREFR